MPEVGLAEGERQLALLFVSASLVTCVCLMKQHDCSKSIDLSFKKAYRKMTLIRALALTSTGAHSR